MTRKGTSARGRTGKPRRRAGILWLTGLALIGVAVAAFLLVRHWAPSRSRYPLQGVSAGSDQGDIAWTALAAQGVDFGYVRAVTDAGRDGRFADNWARVRAAGLRYGAMLEYSLCRKAADQATAFLATVPRDNAALPPVLKLDFDERCVTRPTRGRLLEALDRLLRQMEAHAGKPALVRVSHAFEKHYRIGEGINRTLWLEGDFLPPDYAGRPWVMWTANRHRRIEGVDGPIEWDVVRQ